MDDPAKDGDLERVFAPGGPLAASVENFAPRQEQLDMARAVRDAMASLENLVVEAGTGTGKTFAYLVPALLSHRRVAISTGTRALQDQLFHRDLPTLARAIGLPVRVAMLKGRSNYLCRYRLAAAQPRDDAEAGHLARIRRWQHETTEGDVSEVEDVPDGLALWSRVTSTADNCLGSRCPDYADCFVALARRRAAESDVVVVNHHLLLADLALRDAGFGDLLPAAEVVVVDEAHQIPDIAAHQFGRSFALGQVLGWLRDVTAEASAADLAHGVAEVCSAVEASARELRLLLGDGPRRIAWAALPPAAGEALARLGTALEAAADTLEARADASAGLDGVRRRAAAFGDFVLDFLAPDTADELRWVDVHRQSFTCHRTPIESAATLGAAMNGRPCSWVFTSATLAVASDFSHFLARVGLEDARLLKLESPFDYPRNALLYLPEKMPDPAHPDFSEAVCERALPLIEANPGGTFLLFTSYRALERARRWLDGRTDRLVLAQGDAPRSTLLARFRSDGRAVLLGTASFWEGVDVRGPALSLVVIDRLPFASPGEPLLRARLDWLEAQGRSGFREHQLPAAVIALKQGVGRLIRDHQDRGVLMICDPRLTRRGYGKLFLRSLPPMGRTAAAKAAIDFLGEARAPTAPGVAGEGTVSPPAAAGEGSLP
jgi:ATP-dependent DNA helicase DinG